MRKNGKLSKSEYYTIIITLQIVFAIIASIGFILGLLGIYLKIALAMLISSALVSFISMIVIVRKL